MKRKKNKKEYAKIKRRPNEKEIKWIEKSQEYFSYNFI